VPRLDARLKAVARQIRFRTHADIGSDHAHLLKALLCAGRIERGIAVENKRQPFVHSQATLAGLDAEVRFGDGLEPLEIDEVDSLSICGLGGQRIAGILDAFPDRIPPLIVLQPNKQPECLRRWALGNGFRLLEEQVAPGHWPYQVLTFAATTTNDDPAYAGVDRDAAILFGPLIIKRASPEFLTRLRQEQRYLRRLNRLSQPSHVRLATIDQLLACRSIVAAS
jgi:tRNA (adenine22-N1)-methyltransferase